MSDSVVRTLLIYVNWDKQALIRLMTDKDLDTFIAIANDANPFPHNANPFTNDYDQMVNSFVQVSYSSNLLTTIAIDHYDVTCFLDDFRII